MENEKEMKVCKCCGRELPITMFSVRPWGRDSICKECFGKKISDGRGKKKSLNDLQKQIEEVKKQRLSEFTPRELMEELNIRGYEGVLTYTRVEKIDISKL